MTVNINGREYLMVDDAASETGYTPDYIRRLLRKQMVKGVKHGRVWFVDAESVRGYKTRMDTLGSDKYFQWREG